MAKTKISEYSATAANNTDVESVNIAEGCAPSGINNAIREVMSHLKDFQVGSAGDDLTVGGNFSVTGTVTIPDNAISGDKVEGGTINAITINTLSANPTLSAGTANGVAYLNGSKVLTSGSALTFAGASLGINGASANILFDNGGVGGSSLQLGTSGSSHGYIGTVGSFPLLFQVNGVEAMRIGLATGGLRTVGIGYTSLTSVGDNGLAVFGKVGIGTNSPSGKLQVKQANTAYGLVVEASGNDAWVRFHHNDSLGIVETTYNTSAGYTPLTFKTGGSERLHLDTSGNLGLGVTPSAWDTGSSVRALQFNGGSLWSYAGFGLGLINNAFYASTGAYIYRNNNYALDYFQSSSNGAHIWRTAPSGATGNAIAFTQAMTLNALGNLGITETNPQDKVHIADGTLRISGTTARAIYLYGAPSVKPYIDLNEYGVADNYIGVGTTTSGVMSLNASLGGQAGLHIVAASGKVGINTSSPAGTLHVKGDDGPLRISGGGYVINPTEFTLGQYTSLRAYLQIPGGNSGQIEIWNGGTGNPVIFNNYGIGLNGETPTSGSGIQFSATQQASANANTLDDYEEGTYNVTLTPVTGSITLQTSFASMSYTKVGRLVTVTGNPRILSVSSPTGGLALTLPFPVRNGTTTTSRAGSSIAYYDNSNSPLYFFSIPCAAGEASTTLTIYVDSFSPAAVVPAADDELYVSFTYFTD